MNRMTKLTPKQEKFAQCIADGMTQADAYRAAFDVKNSKKETIQESASRLVANHKVYARVIELKKKLEEKALWTRIDSVNELKEAIMISKSKENPTGLVAAVKELNAMHGFNEPIRIDHSSSDGSMSSRSMTPKEIQAELLRRGLKVKLEDE